MIRTAYEERLELSEKRRARLVDEWERGDDVFVIEEGLLYYDFLLDRARLDLYFLAR